MDWLTYMHACTEAKAAVQIVPAGMTLPPLLACRLTARFKSNTVLSTRNMEVGTTPCEWDGGRQTGRLQ